MTLRPPAGRSTFAALAIAALLTACGSDADSTSGAAGDASASSASPDTSIADTVSTDAASDTTAADATTTTGAPADTTPSTDAAATTEPEQASQAPDFEEGRWVAVRRITENRDYFTGVVAAEALRYVMTCGDAECSTIGALYGGIADADLDLSETQFAWNGTELRFAEELELQPCLSTASGDYDGAASTESTAAMVLRASTSAPGAVLSGTFSVQYVNPGSAECEAEDYGYDADVILFDASQAPTVDAPEAVFSGEAESVGVEAGLRPCTSDEGCDMMMRETQTSTTSAGPRVVAVDVPLTLDADGNYTGSVDYVSPCVSDVDQSFVADDGYVVTQDVTARVLDVGEPVLMAQVRRSGTTSSTMSADQAAVCAPFESTTPFAGVITDAPQLIDWSQPALGPVAG